MMVIMQFWLRNDCRGWPAILRFLLQSIALVAKLHQCWSSKSAVDRSTPDILHQRGTLVGPQTNEKEFQVMPQTPSEFRIEARKHIHHVLKVLVGIVSSETVATNSRIAAANTILDRALGRPTLPLKAEAEDASELPVRIVRNFVTPEEIRQLRAEGREPPRIRYLDADEESNAEDARQQASEEASAPATSTAEVSENRRSGAED
jgi:hypothetical protein